MQKIGRYQLYYFVLGKEREGQLFMLLLLTFSDYVPMPFLLLLFFIFKTTFPTNGHQFALKLLLLNIFFILEHSEHLLLGIKTKGKKA